MYSEYLKPQKISTSTFYPYTVAFRWVNKRIKRDKVVKEFKKRKIPISTGLSRLISDHQFLRGKKLIDHFLKRFMEKTMN